MQVTPIFFDAKRDSELLQRNQTLEQALAERDRQIEYLNRQLLSVEYGRPVSSIVGCPEIDDVLP